MDELYLTTCAMRRMYGRTMPSTPSIFLLEIDKSCLQMNNSAVSARRPMAGRSFNPYNGILREPGNSSAAKNDELEKRAGWKRGQRLFHEDYGYGAVMGVRDSDDGPIVHVCFENGKETRFLSEIQGKAYEKMGDDY
jgi:DNA helicase-2/ATP-dependent DNA helicase PcrA